MIAYIALLWVEIPNVTPSIFIYLKCALIDYVPGVGFSIMRTVWSGTPKGKTSLKYI